MNDLMTLMESRLRELYDFDAAESRSFGATKFYFFDYDEISIKFLNEFLNINYKKLNQIKNLDNLILHIRNINANAMSAFGSGGVCVELNPNKLRFAVSHELKIEIGLNQKIEELKIWIYDSWFSFCSLIDDSIYEICYVSKLKELNNLLPYDITLLEFNNKNKSSVTDIIKSSIVDNSLVYFDDKEFIDKYSNDLDNSFVEKIAVRKFGLKPYEIREALKPFFSAEKLNQVVVTLSHFAFFALLETPDKKFEDIIGHISVASNINKFNRHHDCYYLGINIYNHEKLRSITINTDPYFIAYNIKHQDRISSVTKSFDITRFKGIDAVFNELKNDIATVFKENLNIGLNDISNRDVELVKMMKL